MDFTAKQALVTGADGFIGSHLVEHLLAAGARVRGVAQYNSFDSRGHLDDLGRHANLQVVAGDVRDPRFCDSIVEGVDLVFHLAALIAIPYSYLAPDSFVDTNVRGTLNLCQAARAAGVERFVQTSTSEVYGTARYVPIDELHPLTAQSPYSASKIAADAVALSFHHSFGLPVVVARPFNTYGPRQSARAVIPTIVSQLASGSREVRLGDATTTRDFTYVEDTCRGFLAVAAAENAAGEVFNIGTNTEISIGEALRAIADCMGVEATVLTDPERLRPAASEVRRLRCDPGKLERATGFKATVPFAVGIERTIEWMCRPRNLARYRSDHYTL